MGPSSLDVGPFPLYTVFTMTDSHCHIHFQSYKEDMEEVIARTQTRGVRMITIGTQTSTSKYGIEVAEAHENMWCSVGLHPSHVHRQTIHEDDQEAFNTRAESFDKDYYRELIKSSSKVVAIGEVGLDFFRLPDIGKEDVMETQLINVHHALELANETDMPVILHVRDAHAEMVEVLKQYTESGRLERRGVVHCFTGTIEEARAYHDIGFYTSFTGIMTFRDKKDPEKLTPLMEVARDVPLEWMLVETDAPYLTPEPNRGKRNEPWMVIHVAEKIAKLKGVTVEEVERITDENANKLFKLA